MAAGAAAVLSTAVMPPPGADAVLASVPGPEFPSRDSACGAAGRRVHPARAARRSGSVSCGVKRHKDAHGAESAMSAMW
ncbi:hypothetical protein GCM10010398_51410 [Streptomyces fimbriatus]